MATEPLTAGMSLSAEQLELLEILPNLILLANPAGQFIFANAQARRLLGIATADPEALAGCQERLPGPLRHFCDMAHKHVVRERTPFRAELPAPLGGAYAEMCNIPLTDVAGRLQSILIVLHDLSERVLAERRLREVINLRDTIANTIADAIYVTDSQGTMAEYNRAFCELISTREEEFGREPPYSYLPPAIAAVWREADQRVIQEQIEVQTTTKFPADAGLPARVIETIRTPLRNDDGTVVGSVGIARDVTHRSQTEQALRESELRLELALWGSGHVVWDANIDTGCLELVQPAAVNDSNKDLGIPRKLREFVRRIHPEDRSFVILNGLAHWRGVLSSFQSEFRVMLDKDSWRWYGCRGRATQGPDGQRRMIGSAVDITQQKIVESRIRDSEAVLSQAQRMASIGSLTWHPASNLIEASPQLERMFGLTNRRQLTSIDELLVRIHPEDAPRVQRVVEAIRENQGLTRRKLRGEFRVRRPDGTVGYILAVLSRAEVGRKSPHRIIAVFQDVTRRRLEEETSRHHQQSLAHSLRLHTLGETAAGLAHEITQPLSAIANFSAACLKQLQRDELPPQSLKVWLEAIGEEADRCGLIVDSLRRFVKRTTPQRTALRVSEVLADAVNLLSYELRRRHIRVVQTTHEVPAVVVVDRVQIQQVFVNILLNAFDALEPIPENRLLHISSQVKERRVRIRFHDNGTGVAPGMEDKLFEAFATSKATGMGMGLAITRSILESHEGRIWHERPHAGGAIFVIELPCQPADPTGPPLLPTPFVR